MFLRVAKTGAAPEVEASNGDTNATTEPSTNKSKSQTISTNPKTSTVDVFAADDIEIIPDVNPVPFLNYRFYAIY